MIIPMIKESATKLLHSDLFSRQSLIHMLKYIIVGLVGTVIDFTLFYFLIRSNFLMVNQVKVFRSELINVICSTVSVIHNFIWNAFWNFKSSDQIFRKFLKYYLADFTGIVFTTICIFIFHNRLGFPAIIVKFGASAVAISFQFLFNQFVTFKKV